MLILGTPRRSPKALALLEGAVSPVSCVESKQSLLQHSTVTWTSSAPAATTLHPAYLEALMCSMDTSLMLTVVSRVKCLSERMYAYIFLFFFLICISVISEKGRKSIRLRIKIPSKRASCNTESCLSKPLEGLERFNLWVLLFLDILKHPQQAGAQVCTQFFALPPQAQLEHTVPNCKRGNSKGLQIDPFSCPKCSGLVLDKLSWQPMFGCFTSKN